MIDATHLYTTGDYGIQHQDWHLADAPNKVQDIFAGLQAVVETSGKTKLKVADIGTGVGGVLAETAKQLRQSYPNLEVTPIGFEIAPSAVEVGRQLFPDLDIRQKPLEQSDGPFDLVMFIDVLEHLENPWEMLRLARATGDYMVIRQPLLESFSTFRHNNYQDQREHWGHIGYFNYHSFIDMAATTGWKPLQVNLCASWELAGNQKTSVSPLHRLLTNTNRLMASHFFSGFHLNGAFQRL